MKGGFFMSKLDDLERLMGEIEMLKHLKKDYRELILCNLR